MEDRILINNVWYVREDLIEDAIKEIYTTDFLGCIYETENYSWEATRLFKDDRENFYDDFHIEFINKSLKKQEPEIWDSMAWIEGVYNNDPSSMTYVKEIMNEDGLLHFKAFLKELKKRGWF
jgi:hypothetical protein